MTGVLVNTATVILGSLIGLLLKKGIPEKVSKAVMTAIGLATLYIGISGSLSGDNAIVLILSLAIGTAIGTLLKISDGLDKLGEKLGNRFAKGNASGSVAQGFVTGSLLFCVGAMTVVGSLNAGLSGDNKLLYTKSILDLISSCMLASTLGIGVLFAAAVVFVLQGGLVLLAGLLSGILTDPIVAEMTCAGSVMIIGLGLNILGITKFKIADMLPAIVLVPGVYALVQLLPL